MTVTQTGTTVTGTIAGVSIDFGGITSVFSGTVTGSTSGAEVNLTMNNVVTARAGSDTLICRGTDRLVGSQSGNTISGTFSPGSTYTCDGGISLPLPSFGPGGLIVLTRQ